MGGKTDRVTFFEQMFYPIAPVIARHARLCVALGCLPASCAGGVRLVLEEVPPAGQVRVRGEGAGDLPVLGPLSSVPLAGLRREGFHVSRADESRRLRLAGRSAGSLKKELAIRLRHGAAASNGQ